MMLLKNLLAGARLALFLPVRAEDFRATPVQFALLALFNFVVWIVAAGMRTGFAGEFQSAAIAVYLANVALVLATALLVAQAYRTPERLLLTAVALSASDALFDVTALALVLGGVGDQHPTLFYVLYVTWAWIASLRAAIVCGGWTRPGVYLAGVIVTLMTATALYVIPETEVWQLPEEEEGEVEALVDESVFHAQGRLIERDLAALARGTASAAQLYFVGFAPDASQDVFLNEVRFVRRLFDERFGTTGRSITLASSNTALEELPIASVTNLERALARVGAVMNAEDDVLFLYLTAHGDRAHRLSAVQPPLRLASLTPTALGRMLQDAGVKWRVIVVSACYAGGFIEPLRDENSVVITAASAERTSFGCESGREFTYFGEAYFREALARTRSFTAAFELAKQTVAQKEAEEKLEPSLPQMWVGAAIASKLKSLEQPTGKP